MNSTERETSIGLGTNVGIMEFQHKLVLSRVFRPRYRYAGDALRELAAETSFETFGEEQIPYRTYLIKRQSKHAGAKDVLVRVFYCHGNNQDLYGDWKPYYRDFTVELADQLAQEMPEINFSVFTVVWDYPLYGLSSEIREELVWSELPDKFLKQASHMARFTRSRMSGSLNIDIIYGYSLGTAAAARAFADVGANILMLQAPFSKFVRSLKVVGPVSKWLIPEYFDNVGEIQKGSPNAVILVDVAEKDEIFEAQTVMTDFKALTTTLCDFHLLAFDIGHEGFLSVEGRQDTTRRLKDQVFDILSDHVVVTHFPNHISDSILNLLDDDALLSEEEEPEPFSDSEVD